MFRPWRAGIGIESDPWALGLAGAEAARAAMRPIEAGVTIPRRPTALLPDGEPVGLVLANGIFRDMGWPKFALREIEQLLEPHGRLVATCARRPDQPGKSRESSYFHAFLRLCEEGFFIEDVLIGTDYCCYVGRRSRPAENFSAEKQSGRNRGEPHSFGMDAECLLADQEQLAALASSYRSRATGILEARSNGLAAVRQLREREVSESQAESRRLASQLEQLRERESRIEDELRLRLAGVRYRLGDALVRASQRPGDLLRLPARLVRLFREGQRARNTRRRLGMPEQVESVLDRPSTTALPTDRRIATKQHEPRIDALEIPDRPPRSPLRAAVILDEFTLEAMRLEWKLIEIGPDTWRDELEEDQPEILFIESAWKGNGGRWRRCIESSEAIGEGPLFDLVHWCRERGIPSVFWNKEDPPSFDHFIHAAALFDYVFTTDAGCIKRYRKELGHGRVHTLMFAIQPVIHNPVGTRKSPIESFCFGGTYYNRRHRERRRQIDELLLPALGRGLHIYDRMADSGEAAYRWPRQYADAIQGSLSYRQMVTAYKRYRVFLNVNSVVDSPTMFARRVLEILACGTPVISTYSRGLELALGEEALALVRTPEQADEWMERLLAKAVLGEKMVLHAMRLIFANHTYEKRLRFVLETVGLEPRPVAGRAVTVIGWAEGYAALQPLLASFGCQTHVERDLVLLVREEGPLPTELADAIRALPAVDLQFVPHGEDFGAHLDRVCEAMKSNFVAIMDPDATYGEHYLEDLLLAFEYTDADIVGKNAHYRYDAARDLLEPSAGGVQRAYCDRLARGTLVASSQALKRVRLGNIVRGSEEAFYRESRAAGLIFYASDRFNFARLDGSLSSSPADSAPRSAVAAFSAPDWPSTLAEFVMF